MCFNLVQQIQKQNVTIRTIPQMCFYKLSAVLIKAHKVFHTSQTSHFSLYLDATTPKTDLTQCASVLKKILCTLY